MVLVFEYSIHVTLRSFTTTLVSLDITLSTHGYNVSFVNVHSSAHSSLRHLVAVFNQHTRYDELPRFDQLKYVTSEF